MMIHNGPSVPVMVPVLAQPYHAPSAKQMAVNKMDTR